MPENVGLTAPIKAVAFDLDGTLLDTLPDIAEAGNRMLADLGRASVDQHVVRGFIGNGIAQLTKRLLTGEMSGEPPAALFAESFAHFQRHYRDTLTLRSRPYPHVIESLTRLTDLGLPLACVTNKAESFTVPLLDATGLRRFFALVLSGDSLPLKKPDPLPFLHCAQQLRVRPAELLVIGDSANDVLAARAAGCPVFCVPYGYTERDVRDLKCDAIVGHLGEAVDLIAGVLAKTT
ncbi:MAG: phosphoglycolate phosphatase [Betaproteobacteria bacterium]